LISCQKYFSEGLLFAVLNKTKKKVKGKYKQANNKKKKKRKKKEQKETG
jgi:hypothetical protein